MALKHYDALIVGAGPAGLSAAEQLAKSGFKIGVLEKDQIPGRNKSCGGFLTLKGMRDERIPWTLAERVITGLSIFISGQAPLIVDYPHPIGIQLTREALGAYLWQRVKEAGGDLHCSHRVIAVKNDTRGWIVQVKGTISSFHASLIIGADGVSSTVARLLSFRRRFRSDQLGVTFQVRISLPCDVIDERFGNRMELYYGREVCPFGYLWIFPKRECVYVGVGSLLKTVSGTLEPVLMRFIQQHPIGRSKLKDGRIIRKERALVPLTYQAESYANGVMLAGDAAGHCSAITGEGIHYALAAGRIAGRIGAVALSRGNVNARFLRKYERMWQRTFGSDLKWGLRLRNLFFQGLYTKDLGAGIVASSRLLKLTSDLIVGLRPYQNTILRAIPFYLWHRIHNSVRRT